MKNRLIKKIRDLISVIKEEARIKNIIYVIFAQIGLLILYLQHKLFKNNRSFVFKGKRYKYFCDLYYCTWRNERAVEIPIMWDVVKMHKGEEILELGNVLSHYYSVKYDIIDKYEKSEGVINKDIVDFNPGKKYDLIVSISTIEHIGMGEFGKKPSDPHKILKALDILEYLLSPGGTLAVTFPTKFNPSLDKLLKEGKLKFTEKYYLKKISKENNWIECTFDEVINSAKGLVVGIFKK